jgi:Domain of unknown function (DUF4326)
LTPRPVRLQLSRAKGFNLQAHSRAINGLPAARVDRATRWGNPHVFVIGDKVSPGLRFACETLPLLDVKPLRGKNLACWCALPRTGEEDKCHGAILLEAANREDAL